MASEAQIAANRRNARRSTGPRTVEGKRRSRANSIKHGLCASAVVIEDLALVQERAILCYNGLKPQDRYQAYMADQVAVFSIRADRCGRMERRARDKACLRAILTWDDDRDLEAKALGRRLASNPEEIVGLLRKTPHGCDWLIDRWSRLADAARRQENTWTEDQSRLAFDLLGTPREFREGLAPGAVFELGGAAIGPAESLADLALRQLEELETHREVVAELDEAERALAEADLAADKDPEVRRVRRYESAIHRQIRWFIAQIKSPTPHLFWPGHLMPGWNDQAEAEAEADLKPEPELKPERPTREEVLAEGWTPEKINPPFDLEPHEYPEPGQSADIPRIVKDRKRERLAKAEARRQSRRRKLEALRA